MNGFTQVMALAGVASAVATAVMSTVGTPKNAPIKVGTAFSRSTVRNTCTRTRLSAPLGAGGNVTSAEVTDTFSPRILFSCAVSSALRTTGPAGDRSV